MAMSYVIAEAGTNHAHRDLEQRVKRALELISAARNAGADAVKFQAFFPDEPLFCPYDGDDKRWPRWNDSFLPEAAWASLHEIARLRGIDLLFSVFQPRGIAMLKEIKPRYIKVASRAAKNFPYDDFRKNDIVASCGLVSPPSRVHRLQCSMKYPTPLKEARWEEWHPDDGPFTSGLSDHSGTIWPGIDAILRGAKFLEVHFNIPGCDPGPDAPVCLTTDQLKLLCEAREAARQMDGG